MKIYDLLERKRRREVFRDNREIAFFRKHNNLLYAHPDFLLFDDEKNDFRVIVATIIMQALMQIEKLKKESYEQLVSRDELTTFVVEKTPISIPLFSFTTNVLVANGLLEDYDITKHVVDFLEVYNFALFESNFTSLVLLKAEGTTRAYYHYDFNTVYIINKQGRLDQKICLFDKHLKNPNYEDILTRIAPALEAYYAVDQIAFVRALRDEKLISERVYGRYIRSLGRRK